MNPNIDPTPDMPTFFRAPKSVMDCCISCSLAIIPGQICTEFEGEYLHESCYEMMIADAMEPDYDN